MGKDAARLLWRDVGLFFIIEAHSVGILLVLEEWWNTIYFGFFILPDANIFCITAFSLAKFSNVVPRFSVGLAQELIFAVFMFNPPSVEFVFILD